MRFRTETYDLIVFDCDGVILDSNRVKSLAFFEVARRFGDEKAQRFVEYHKSHGGISRQEKFKYFVAEILRADPSSREVLEKELVDAFGESCRSGLRSCRTIGGIRSFLGRQPSDVRNFVVSGGSETEVREVLAERGLDRYFERILGNPRSKQENMQRLLDWGCLSGRGVYFGDARLDMELANQFDLDFIFVSGASEWADAAADLGGPRIYDFAELEFKS